MRTLIFVFILATNVALSNAVNAQTLTPVSTLSETAQQALDTLKATPETHSLPTFETGSPVNDVCNTPGIKTHDTLTREDYPALLKWSQSLGDLNNLYVSRVVDADDFDPSTSPYSGVFGTCLDTLLIVGVHKARIAHLQDTSHKTSEMYGKIIDKEANLREAYLGAEFVLKMGNDTDGPDPAWVKDRLATLKFTLPHLLPVLDNRRCHVLKWRAKSVSPEGYRVKWDEPNIANWITCPKPDYGP